jgi:integrase
MKQRISKRTVDALRPGQSIADLDVRGFTARCLPSGAVTYDFRYRTATGERHRISLGLHGAITPDQARARAEKRLDDLAAERDPAAERRRARGNTVNAVLDNFVARYLQNKRSAPTVQSAFDRLVRPAIGARSIYDLRRGDMAELFDGIEDSSGPVMADRTLAYLRKAFHWQQSRDENFISPIVKGMARTKPSEHQRDRMLDDTELRDLWRALDQINGGAPACFPAFVRALLLTGQRRTEVSEMTSGEVTGNQWVIPAERMKGKRPHLVPIVPDVKMLIGNRQGFLFSSDGGKTPFSGYSKAKAALDRKIAELRKSERHKPMPHWTPHDLRRTARSIMSRYATADIAERVIGHVIPGVRGVYDLYEYEDEKRAALEKLADHIRRVVS